MEGQLEGLPSLLLIDGGTSHNYITKELVTSLSLLVIGPREFMVNLGDGSRRVSQGKCEGLVIIVGKNFLQVGTYISS